ncbi:MAG TPA: response regulator [Methanomicrobiales archaeon]|nr:response regulator [Methanomicrobiales archaeon]
MQTETRNGGPAAPAPGIAVLYVDDEPALLELTTIFLGRDGDLEIDTALSARIALGMMEKRSYDVIVADYLMPEMDGIEFLKGLRGSGCTIPFIIFTGKGREDVAIEALNSGADFYLQKGGDPRSQFAELANMIRQAARKRRAEGALRESEQRLHAILKGSPIPQFVIDRNHRVVYWNRALEQHTGVPAGEVIGTTAPWKAFYPAERPVLSDLLVDGKTEELARWYGEKVAVSGHVEGAYEVKDFFPRLGRHGSWLCFTAVPIPDETGKVIGALETLEDITEQVTAEESLRERATEVEEAHAQLEAIFQAFPDAYLRLDPDGAILDLRTRDPSPLFLPYERLRTRLMKDLLSPAEGAPVEEAIRGAHARGEMQILEFNHEVEGSRHTYEGRFIPVLGSQVIGIIRDITGWKADEAALRQANAKLQLLSGITRHDILNLLTALSAYQQLAIEASSDPTVLGYLEKQYGLTRQIQSLIEFTRFYQKIGVGAPVWQDLYGILTRVVQHLDTRGIRVSYDLEGVEIYADPLLERVFSNLIENAVYHGEGVTSIRFGYLEGPPGLMVTCEDDGKGIPADEKEQVFAKGYGQHSGLGLFLVREILSITGLTIRETGEPGQGARFEITVPPGNYRILDVPGRALHEPSTEARHLPAQPSER